MQQHLTKIYLRVKWACQKTTTTTTNNVGARKSKGEWELKCRVSGRKWEMGMVLQHQQCWAQTGNFHLAETFAHNILSSTSIFLFVNEFNLKWQYEMSVWKLQMLLNRTGLKRCVKEEKSNNGGRRIANEDEEGGKVCKAPMLIAHICVRHKQFLPLSFIIYGIRKYFSVLLVSACIGSKWTICVSCILYVIYSMLASIGKSKWQCMQCAKNI